MTRLSARLAGLAPCAAALCLCAATSAQAKKPRPQKPAQAKEPAPGSEGAPAPLANADTLYALGLTLGDTLMALHPDARELTFIEAGMGDVALGRAPKIELLGYGERMAAFAKRRGNWEATQRRQRDDAVVAKAAEAAGARRLPSGAVLRIVREGTGPSPTAQSTVTAHYRGRLVGGKVFDSSYERGEPLRFALGSVIPCWTQALQLLRAGGKAEVSCPAELAYGDAGSPPAIPGGAALLYEIELLSVDK